MAQRPVFVVTDQAHGWVRVETVGFTWFPGMSLAQKRRSIDAMQAAARQRFPEVSFLEISTKSADADGRALSGFELCLEAGGGRRMSVESVFQGSKVCRPAHAGGSPSGPFQELYDQDAVTAKRDPRLSACHVQGFRFFDTDWPVADADAGGSPPLPPSAFYDFLYFRALTRQPALAARALAFGGFTDLEFTPGRSDNCQAFSAALFAALTRGQGREEVAALAASGEAFRAGAHRLGCYAGAATLWGRGRAR